MIFIGGISQGRKILDYVRTVICGCCGRYGRYEVIMTYTYFSFFFIPLFKWNRQFYVRMTCCGAVYSLEKEVGQQILAGRDVEIRPEDLTLVQGGDGSGTYGQVKKHCDHCGYETFEDFEYCPKCGERF